MTEDVTAHSRRTERLRLRRPTEPDLPWMVALHSDPANYLHAPDGAHAPRRAREVATMAIDDWARDGIGFWIVEHDDEPIGMAGVKRMDFHARPCFNVYYRFVAAGRGHGFAAEACREALAVAAAVEPERPVVVRTRPTNGPARRLALRLGLERRADLDADGFVVYVSAWDREASARASSS